MREGSNKPDVINMCLAMGGIRRKMSYLRNLRLKSVMDLMEDETVETLAEKLGISDRNVISLLKGQSV